MIRQIARALRHRDDVVMAPDGPSSPRTDLRLGKGHAAADGTVPGRTTDAGFTLVELIVAVTVLVIIAIALLSVVSAAQAWTSRAQERENMVNFTAGYMELIRGMRYSEIGTGPSADPTGSVTPTTTVVGAYTVQVAPTITWMDDPTIPGIRDYKMVSLAATASVTETGESVMTTVLESVVSSIGVR